MGWFAVRMFREASILLLRRFVAVALTVAFAFILAAPASAGTTGGLRGRITDQPHDRRAASSVR